MHKNHYERLCNTPIICICRAPAPKDIHVESLLSFRCPESLPSAPRRSATLPLPLNAAHYLFSAVEFLTAHHDHHGLPFDTPVRFCAYNDAVSEQLSLCRYCAAIAPLSQCPLRAAVAFSSSMHSRRFSVDIFHRRDVVMPQKRLVFISLSLSFRRSVVNSTSTLLGHGYDIVTLLFLRTCPRFVYSCHHAFDRSWLVASRLLSPKLSLSHSNVYNPNLLTYAALSNQIL